MDQVTLIECPRDAWQGLKKIIPAEVKAAYLRKLIKAGFRHLDAVSFVAPKYVPQMADSEEAMKALVRSGALDSENRKLKIENCHALTVSNDPGPIRAPNPESRVPSSEIIGIVVNEKGLERALATPGVTTLGYPYSVSANFRRQNANMSLSESRALVQKLQEATRKAGRNLVVYISMAFGNPFGEPWGKEVVEEAILWLKKIGVKTASLADTVGLAEPEDVGNLFAAVKDAAQGLELGVHLHGRPEAAAEKILAAFEAGCRRFDSALTGLGGCPFAGDELVGNIPTEIVVATLAARGVAVGPSPRIESRALLSALEATQEIRRNYAAAASIQG